MAHKFSAIDLRSGEVIDFEKSIWRVLTTETSGTGRGSTRTKIYIKNLHDNKNKEVSLNPDVKVNVYSFEVNEYRFSHENGCDLICFDEHGEEKYLPRRLVSDEIMELITDQKIIVSYLDDEIFKITIPK